jgi:hypothetical protein
MTAPIQLLTDHLAEREISFHVDEESGVVHASILLAQLACQFVANIEHEDSLRTAVAIPIRAPKEKIVPVGELTHRINLTLTHGDFLLDPDDGEIRFVVSHFFGEDDISEEAIDHLIDTCKCAIELWGPVYIEVIFSDTEPCKAMRTRLCSLGLRPPDEGEPGG